jgi:inorganic pyrophosphatase
VEPNAGAPGHDRLQARLIVEQPAGPHNRYRIDPRAGTVVLEAVEANAPVRPFERGRLADTRGPDGRPLRAVMPVRVPTFPGCMVPVYPIAALQPVGQLAPLVVVVPVADPTLAPLRALAELNENLRQAILAEAPTAEVVEGAAAETLVRGGIEAELRARAAAQRPAIPAWKASDVRPRYAGGRELEPHTYAEQAVPLLPARFQEYIARALLPEERILMFIHRPVTETGGFRLRRTKLREGIFVLTDRQVMLMTDTVEPDSTMVHWGFIARVSAVERVTAVQARVQGTLAHLVVTLAARRGAETVSFAFPAAFMPAVEEAAALIAGFIPAADTRALRRCYPRELPVELPSLATVQAQMQAPTWARDYLPDERPLAWARTEGDRERAAVVVGERRVVLDGADKAGPLRIALDDITSVQMTLALVASGLEVAVAEGEAIRRPALRFPYPAAGPFLTAFTALRHLLGLPPERG